ncbi:hypothetical protein Tco_0200123 [Tanacetum coccineum]
MDSFQDLLQKVPHHGIDLWLQVQIFYDSIDHTLKRAEDYTARGQLRKLKGSLDYENLDIEQLLRVMECKVDTLMKEAISVMRRSKSIFGMTSNTVYQLPSEPSRQEEFENLMMNFILDQEEKVKKLEEYMGVIGSDFMQLSLEVVGKLKEEIRMKKYSQKDQEDHKSLCVKHVCIIFPNPPLVRENTFNFKSGIRNSQNIKSRHDVENPDPQSTPQFLPSFKEYTPPVTYPKEVKEIIGIPIEVEPLNETPLEDLRMNTCNHDIPLSSREIHSFDGPEPQPLLNSPSLDVSLEDVIGLEPPIKPHSPDSSRMKEMFDDDWGLESKEVSPLGE